MTRLENRHPLLWAYRVLADIRFIIAVNLIIAVMIFRHVSGEKVDLTMSWATMAMDQVIIAAGWVLVTIGVKHRKEDRAQWARIERMQGETLALVQAQQQTILALQRRVEMMEMALSKWCDEIAFPQK